MRGGKRSGKMALGVEQQLRMNKIDTDRIAELQLMEAQKIEHQLKLQKQQETLISEQNTAIQNKRILQCLPKLDYKDDIT